MTDQETSGEEAEVTLEHLQEWLALNPFHQWLGLELVRMQDGEVEITARWREEFLSNPHRGFAHGGILAALVDTTADFAIAARLGRPYPTIDLRIDYHTGARRGPLRAVGKLIKLGRTFSTAEAFVYGTGEQLLASGRAAYFTGWSDR